MTTLAGLDADVLERVTVPPAFLHRPTRSRSLLPQVLKVCASVGRFHEPEQALAVDVLTGLKPNGAPASLSAVVICARQNLKTYVMENIVLTRMVDPTDTAELFIWTSQQLDTAQETFRHFVNLWDNPEYPHMRRRLKKITAGNGAEEIELLNGRRLKFKARAPKSGQGLTGDVVVLDEGFAVEEAHVGALLPTLSTRKRASVLIGSSAGHKASKVLRGFRDRGRTGGTGAPAYVEWCAPGDIEEPGCVLADCRHTPGVPGCVLDDERLVQLANPLAGREPHGIAWSFLHDERLDLPAAEYARERLGWWDKDPDEGAKHPLSLERWKELALEGAVPREAPAFFITVGVDGAGCIAVAADRPGPRDALDAVADALTSAAMMGTARDTRPHVELADMRPGTAWLPERIRELKRSWPRSRFAANKAGPVAGMVDAGLPGNVELLPPGEIAQACRHHEQLHKAAGYTHSGDPDVDQSFRGAVSKLAGDGLWAWDWRQSTGLAPMAGVTGALWLVEKYRGHMYDLLESVR